MLNMYAIIWNQWVKDIVIAHDEEEAYDLASSEIHEVDAHGMPIKLLDDTLQTITSKGIMTLREVIDIYNVPIYVHGIDDIRVSFESIEGGIT